MPHWNRRFQREAPTALSGSHFKPPALPKVSDSFFFCSRARPPHGHRRPATHLQVRKVDHFRLFSDLFLESLLELVHPWAATLLVEGEAFPG